MPCVSQYGLISRTQMLLIGHDTIQASASRPITAMGITMCAICLEHTNNISHRTVVSLSNYHLDSTTCRPIWRILNIYYYSPSRRGVRLCWVIDCNTSLAHFKFTGHIKPLCALAGRLVAEKNTVVVTFLLSPTFLDKALTEISAQLPPGHKAFQRIR